MKHTPCSDCCFISNCSLWENVEDWKEIFGESGDYHSWIMLIPQDKIFNRFLIQFSTKRSVRPWAPAIYKGNRTAAVIIASVIRTKWCDQYWPSSICEGSLNITPYLFSALTWLYKYISSFCHTVADAFLRRDTFSRTTSNHDLRAAHFRPRSARNLEHMGFCWSDDDVDDLQAALRT